MHRAMDLVDFFSSLSESFIHINSHHCSNDCRVSSVAMMFNDRKCMEKQPEDKAKSAARSGIFALVWVYSVDWTCSYNKISVQMCKHKRFEDTPSSEKNPTKFWENTLCSFCINNKKSPTTSLMIVSMLMSNGWFGAWEKFHTKQRRVLISHRLDVNTHRYSSYCVVFRASILLCWNDCCCIISIRWILFDIRPFRCQTICAAIFLPLWI